MHKFNSLKTWITVFIHDVLTIPLAWVGAYWIRFNLDEIPDIYLNQLSLYLLLIIPVQTWSFWYFGLYRGVWRFASIPDLVRIVKAVLVGVILSMALLFVVTRLQDVPRSIFPLYVILMSAFLGGPRFIYRWVKDYGLSYPGGKRILIIGAGQAGEMFARELMRDPLHQYQPMAFLDDDVKKSGKEIHGIRVVGNCEKIPEIVAEMDIDLIIFALPTANSQQIRRLVELSEDTETEFRMLPKMAELLSGHVHIDELREVSIEDLLGRDSVSMDWKSIKAGLSGKRIMVTGAGGSIGSELCRQLTAVQPAGLMLFENSEFNLYSIDKEFHENYQDINFSSYLGDVADKEAVARAMQKFKPQIIFHAAAYKHVPLLEDQVREAVLNNVSGTRNIALAADEYQCERFVLISTDKAVNPTNVMGTTKRISEMICQSLDRGSDTKYITVRFGNVLGSAGSVVPLFRKQIKAGGPVTVTHKDIIRYFMTIPEATQLIMQASVLGDGGEIFVLDMGEPVAIMYLAEQMITLAGKKPNVDIEIEITGLRPGEKLFEELFHSDEKLSGTRHEKILLADSRVVDREYLDNSLDNIIEACDINNNTEIRSLMVQLVPEFNGKPPEIDASGNVIPFENKQ